MKIKTCFLLASALCAAAAPPFAAAEGGKGDLTEKIAAKFEVAKTDAWFGGRRTVFRFHGREAWVVEPPEDVPAADGCPWTWTIQWWDAFVSRTGVPQLLKKGYCHAVLDMFDTRAKDEAMPEFAAFQDFLVKDLGFAPKVNLIGLSWGGFFSTRYAAHYPQNVSKIFLDCPLLNLGGRCGRAAGEDEIGVWAKLKPENWIDDPRMPINLVAPVAKAGIPILLRYGGADNVLEPALNSEIFIPRFKAAGGHIRVVYQIAYGHHPHGFEESDTTISDFFVKGIENE